MRINPEFILRDIAGDKVLVPTGSASQYFNGLITMNEVGTFIFENVEKVTSREQLTDLVLETYEVDEDTARRDVNGFLDMLKSNNILLEDNR